MRVGHLFAGIDGLGLGLEPHGFETVWFSEYEPAPSRVLEHHYPDVPNHGDITTIDWSQVEPVDVLTGGFPCQDLSYAGKGAGIKEGTRSGLWFEYVRAIRTLRPRVVIVENVSALLRRGLDIVLGDLAACGFDAEWSMLRASDVGAAHRRERLFIVAYANSAESGPQGRSRRRIQSEQPCTNRGTVVADGDLLGHVHGQPGQHSAEAGIDALGDVAASDHQDATDTDGIATRRDSRTAPRTQTTDAGRREPDHRHRPTHGNRPTQWGEFGPAIRREGRGTDAVLDEPSEPGDGILGHDENVLRTGLPDQDSCTRLVQETLHPVEGDGRSGSGEEGRPETDRPRSEVLGEGQEDLDLLAMDRREGEQVRTREVRETQGPSLGIRASNRPDPGGPNARPSLPCASVREPRPSGAGDASRERAASGRSEDGVPTGSPTLGRQPVPRSEVELQALSDLQAGSRLAAQGETVDWGEFAPAIARWAAVIGRPAPDPTVDGRLSPDFVEWHMGFPPDWTSILTRNERLKALGNAVVPQCADVIGRWVLDLTAERQAA